MTGIREKSIEIYSRARDFAAQRGIIIADTKFEFGLEPVTGDLVLIDEVLTPDSSRFWPAEEWEPGREQNSFDKQYVRNYTEELVAAGQWNKEYPAPTLPDKVIAVTLGRYQEAVDRLGIS
jgi:phosphoribosylaminoimidazole-succinocarboxamide synthase